MLKLLIADTSEVFMQLITKQCKKLFEIYRCTDGLQVLEAVRKIRPQILLLDLHLPGVNGMDVLRTIRSSGTDIEVIVTGYLQNDAILYELECLQISCFLPKPCDSGAVVSRLQDLATKIQSGEQLCQSPRRAVNHILLNLGLRMGLSRYQYVCQALMLKFEGEDGGVTKCLYPKVAKLCGGNPAQVEKAIRDAIKDGFNHGNPEVWKMYFAPEKGGILRCPSNEVFLGRIAYALQEQFEIISGKKAQ